MKSWWLMVFNRTKKIKNKQKYCCLTIELENFQTKDIEIRNSNYSKRNEWKLKKKKKPCWECQRSLWLHSMIKTDEQKYFWKKKLKSFLLNALQSEMSGVTRPHSWINANFNPVFVSSVYRSVSVVPLSCDNLLTIQFRPLLSYTKDQSGSIIFVFVSAFRLIR